MDSQRSFINPDSGTADSSQDKAEVLRTAALSSELSDYWEKHAASHSGVATGGGRELYRWLIVKAKIVLAVEDGVVQL